MKLGHTEFDFARDKGKYWKCYCTVDWIPEGKTKKWRPSCNGKTKKQAREKLEAKILARELELESSEINEADKTENKDMSNTIAEELKRYALKKQEGKIKNIDKKLKVGSINDKNELIRNLVEPYIIGKIKADKITRKDIIDWLDELKANGKSEKRCKGAYNLLTDYYNNYYCNEVDVNFISPASGFKFSIKKSEADVMRTFSDNETIYYFKTCEELGEQYDILRCMLYLYCRVGEAATLTWSDWDQENKLHIHSTWTRDKDGKFIVDRNRPKTESSDRYLILPWQVNGLLTVRYFDAEQEGRNKPNDWIFPSIKDPTKPLSLSTVNNLHKQVQQKLYKRVRVHDLRHSGVSFNIRHSQNKDKIIGAISKNAGHSSIDITTKIYHHVMDTELEELANYSSQLYNTIAQWK